MKLPVLLGCLATIGWMGACTGDIGDALESSDEGEGTQGPGGTGPTLIPDDGTYQPFRGADTVYAKSRIWQLTPVQYQAAVASAIGAPVDLSTIQATGRQEDFMNQADGLQVDSTSYADLEEAVQQIVVTHAKDLEAQLKCSVDALDQACLKTFLGDFGARLLRVQGYAYDRYVALYDTLHTKLPPGDAFQGVVAALLLSPKALFRTELGDPTDNRRGVVSLTPGELAESLAFSLWNGPPDKALLSAAAAGSLDDSAALAKEIARMLAASGGHAGMSELISQWLGTATFMSLEKNPTVFPEFDDAMKTSMSAETRGFIDRTLARPDASFTTLLTSNAAQIDAKVASVYGLHLAGTAASAVTLPGAERRGILTQPAVIAAMSEPTYTGVIYRGKFLLRKLLCTELSPPAGLVVPQEVKDALAADATTRVRLLSIQQRDGCKTCHTLLHPMALAMETYDAIGRYRTTENGEPIDPSGALFFTELTQQPFQNATQMIDLLAGSEEVYQCFVRQTFRYLLGRREDTGDDPTLRAAFGDFRASHDMAGLVTRIVQSDSFRMRERMQP
jgi:Protein of unknown function (DUF1592)/Protein of unknown function (DUF1588)/Protein of unknown function (DUF1585)